MVLQQAAGAEEHHQAAQAARAAGSGRHAGPAGGRPAGRAAQVKRERGRGGTNSSIQDPKNLSRNGELLRKKKNAKKTKNKATVLSV